MSNQFNAHKYTTQKLENGSKLFTSRYDVAAAVGPAKKKVQRRIIKSCTTKINSGLNTNFSTVPPVNRKRTNISINVVQTPARSLRSKSTSSTPTFINPVTPGSAFKTDDTQSSATIDFNYPVDMHGNTKMPPSLKTTTNMGYQRQLPCELTHLNVGDEIIIVLRDLDLPFAKRLLSAVGESFDKKSEVLDYIQSSHRVQRDGTVMWEFGATIKSYPHKYDFIRHGSQSDIDRLWKQGDGFGILLDGYEYTATLDLHMREATSVEVWKLGDSIKPNHHNIQFANAKHKRVEESFAEDFEKQLSDVYGDPLRTRDVYYKWLQAVNTIKQRSIQQYKTCKGDDDKSSSRNSTSVAPSSTTHIKTEFKTELKYASMKSYCDYVDKKIDDIVMEHYSTFQQEAVPLVGEFEWKLWFDKLGQDFPLTTVALKSIAMSQRNLQPHQEMTSNVERKERAVVEHFLSLCRVHHVGLATSWAAIDTLAKLGHGMPKLSTQAAGTKSFSLCMDSALEYLEKMRKQALPARNAMLAELASMGMTKDNWQRKHSVNNARDKTGSAEYHHGVAFSAKRDKYTDLPVNTLVMSPTEKIYRVVKCERKSIYELWITIQPSDEDTEQNETILWPCLGWHVKEVPGFHTNTCPRTTYQDGNTIPTSYHCIKPISSSLDDMIFVECLTRTHLHMSRLR